MVDIVGIIGRPNSGMNRVRSWVDCGAAKGGLGGVLDAGVKFDP